MQGTIVNFKGSHRTQDTHYLIIKPENCDSKAEAEKLIGKSVIWKTPAGKELKGTVKSAHGNKGAIRARFEKGLPGQSLGTKVSIE